MCLLHCVYRQIQYTAVLCTVFVLILSIAMSHSVALAAAPHKADLYKHERPAQHHSVSKAASYPVKAPLAARTTLTVNVPPTAHTVPAATSLLIPWNANAQGEFILSMTGDRQGHVWVGTEGQGIWRFDRSAPASKQWTQFQSSNGLGDNNGYALTCDHLGRIWAGTASHGVSVYNGKSWKAYDQVTGPLGAHVTALAVSPKDGSVWMGSEMGLARYEDGHGWRYWTRADGLPSDQITCLAFALSGLLYVGTDCGGLAVGSPMNHYAAWRHVPGPLTLANQGRGVGLPSAAINAVLVSRSGVVYCGTDAGLAWSNDGGLTWTYRRGADWLDKGAGAYQSGLVDNAKLCGIEVTLASARAGTAGLAVAAAGGATGRFVAPYGFIGGQEGGAGNAVDVRGIQAPAPQEVYQKERWGTFTWMASSLVPRGEYKVRLHFAELFYNQPGQRVFNMFVGGVPILNHFDVLKAAGGRDKALVREFTARADGLGRLTLSFQGSIIQGASSASDLLEDYVTCLAEDASGHLWIGHWRTGMESLDEQTGARVWPGLKDRQQTDYVAALLSTTAGLQVGGYGDGLTSLNSTTLNLTSTNVHMVASLLPILPAPAPAPSVKKMQEMLGHMRLLSASAIKASPVSYVGTDWVTSGDWVGRYGRQYAVLYAAGAPLDHEIISDPEYHVTTELGPHCRPDDGLRHWIHWVHTDDPRVLYDPIPGYRRESEADDHGENYPAAYEGPDIWVQVAVPAGVHRLSLYFMNKDGHSGYNRFRDYLVEIKPNRNTVAEAQAAPVLASARVHGFWNGQYQQFSVEGPASYWVRVSRNGSVNAILQAIFLDHLDGPSSPSQRNQMAWMGNFVYAAPSLFQLSNQNKSIKNDETMRQAALTTIALSSRSSWTRGALLQEQIRLYALRYFVEQGSSNSLLEAWRWNTHIWAEQDRGKFDEAMSSSRASLLRLNPEMATKSF